ncbi:MAG: copper oxidase [Pyrinomonadaceae bacterium]
MPFASGKIPDVKSIQISVPREPDRSDPHAKSKWLAPAPWDEVGITLLAASTATERENSDLGGAGEVSTEAPTLTPDPSSTTPAPDIISPCRNIITAKVAAIDQVYFYNRFGAFNPAGMMYALLRDIEQNSSGDYQLRKNKRPRPIVLRVNEGDCLEVEFHNLLHDPRPNKNSTTTRNASMHVNGMDYLDSIDSDGANVGENSSSLVKPGDHKTYRWYGAKQGQYLLHSMGAAAGGEGDGGQVGLGLFGSVNVEPKGSKWYRSQVTNAEFEKAVVPTPNSKLKINYEATDPATLLPVLNLLNGNEIIHTDLNAIITDPSGKLQENCAAAPPSSTCGQPFREFTTIFHDEIKAVQAFEELDKPLFHGVRDGFAINYGSDSLGARLIANRKELGPSKNCNECKFEEFFLESHVQGDPAVIVKKDPNSDVVPEALFPDDPANVHHSYLNDPVRFLNTHAGPKETHVFHLHAHQWLQSPRDQNSTYLDSQTISPGAAFTYEINYGGSGNRNINPGDAIFHCHLYPHFAQGMWELWRNHDVFERGTPDRNLPDAEITQGIPQPALVPIPGKPLPVMPTAAFLGYPFYIAGEVGHRPPQPPYDMEFDGGLQRHILRGLKKIDGKDAVDPAFLADPVADRVLTETGDISLLQFARKLVTAQWQPLNPIGEPAEQEAIKFHAGTLFPSVDVQTQYGWKGKAYQTAYPDGTTDEKALFVVNGLPPQSGAPYADPCPKENAATLLRKYRAAYIQFDMVVNKYKWHDRQARITMLEQDALDSNQNPKEPEPLFFRANSRECVTFAATNLVPSNLNLDDFQIFTPTDIIGQHIHLVKFDVTSSDGAGNGWNYEDGTFSPDEVRERVAAIRKQNNCPPLGPPGPHTDPNCPVAVPHPVFGAGEKGQFVGAQTTIQRWWADPLLNIAGQDRTIRTVFSHDHFGPSSHQHHGLYAALVIEPKESKWEKLDGSPLGGRPDGGPTSFAANIIPNDQKSFREFNLAFADFGIVYTAELQPVNPPGRKEADLPIAIEPTPVPMPEAISAADPGTQLINYRNEPIPLRIGQKTSTDEFVQKPGDAGDLAKVFDSRIHKDPFTPLLQAYEGDRAIVRLIQGAQEEQHVFNVHGLKWLFEPSVANSGYRNGQQIGISEHFEFEVRPVALGNNKLFRRFTDLLYSSAATDNLWDGQWGIMRVYQGLQPHLSTQEEGAATSGNGSLKPLPDNPVGELAGKSQFFNSVCPATAPERPYTVYALLARDLLPGGSLVYNDHFKRVIEDRDAILFVDKEDVDALKAGDKQPEPLILRAAAGECLKVTLYNQLPKELPEHDSWNLVPMIVNRFNFNQIRTSNRVGLHPQLVAVETRNEDGANVGYNNDSTVGPDESITYTWYAGDHKLGGDGLPAESPIEFGAIGLRDMGDVIKHSSHGAIGSLVVEPKDSTWSFDKEKPSRASADILDKDKRLIFREFVVLYQDDLSLQLRQPWHDPSFPDPLPNIGRTDDSEDTGMKAFNYRSEPFWLRLGTNIDDSDEENNEQDYSNVLSSIDPNPGCGGACGDPATPVFTAEPGSPVRFRVVHVAGHPRQHAFTLHGHHWNFEPWTANSTVQGFNPFTFEVGSYSGIGPTRHENILTTAGGIFSVRGDYLFRTQESYNFSSGGLWGIFRVKPKPPLAPPGP